MSYLRNLTFRIPGSTGAWWRRKALHRSLKSELADQLGPVFEKRIDELTVREQYSLVFQRILLQRPRVLFCEQPFWGNDMLLRQHVVEQLRRQLERGCSVVVLIVGMYDGFPLANRTMIYREGRLIVQSDRG